MIGGRRSRTRAGERVLVVEAPPRARDPSTASSEEEKQGAEESAAPARRRATHGSPRLHVCLLAVPSYAALAIVFTRQDRNVFFCSRC